MFKDHKLPEISEDIISYVFDNFRGGQPVIICLFFFIFEAIEAEDAFVS